MALAALLLITACSDRSRPTEPVLTIEPVELGGPHAPLFGALFHPQQGYRIAYLGERRAYGLAVETWRDGERVEIDRLGGIRYGPVSPSEFTLALLTRPPSREGEPLALVVAGQTADLVGHNETRLEAWSEEEGGPGVTLHAAWNEATRLDCAIGEPVTLWRWVRAENPIRPQPLTEVQAVPGETVMQVTITFSN